MSARYPRVYRLLKSRGHSPMTAIQILLDAQRGNYFAVEWVRVCFWGRR